LRVLEFGEAVLPFVELDVEDANLADVAAFEGVESIAQGGEAGLANGERGAQRSEFAAAAGKLEVFRAGAAEDGV
jgi:hypothetical protein